MFVFRFANTATSGSSRVSFEHIQSSDLPPPSPFDFAAIPSPQLPRSTAHFAPVTSPFDAFSPTLTPTTPPQFASALSSSFASFPQARSFPSPSIWQDGGSWHSHRQQVNSSPWFDAVPHSPRQSASFSIGQLFAEPRFDQVSASSSRVPRQSCLTRLFLSTAVPSPKRAQLSCALATKCEFPTWTLYLLRLPTRLACDSPFQRAALSFRPARNRDTVAAESFTPEFRHRPR